MKTILLFATLITTIGAVAQVNYTVTVKRLKATADPCDGGTPPFCVSAPQDPVFNIWSMDGAGNENTYCWVFDGDPEIEYNLWKDIQNLELAAGNNVNTTFINIDMAGHEGDALWAPSCTPDAGDDAEFSRQFVYQFDLASIPQGTPYTQVVDLADVYYAELEINWVDLSSTIGEISDINLFSFYPNPSNGEVIIIKNGESPALLELLDLNGRVVKSEILNAQSTNLNLMGLNGMYILDFSEGDKHQRQLLSVK